MCQNILLVIRQDIKNLSDQVTALQGAVDDVRANLPDVTEINDKLDAQNAQLVSLEASNEAISTLVQSLSEAVQNITDILTPDIPDLPIPDPPLGNKKNNGGVNKK
uniref:p10 n=1 Tax=Spodoptera litura multicapsid nucleopolyhedrovirus TaxID=46242 RepID=D5K689_NPVST|nr:P10 [Spodoptera litura nucleopolyhedrovirus]